MVTWPALIHLPVAPGPVTGQALSAARGSLSAQCELVAVSLGPSVEIHGCCLSFCFCSLVLSVLMVLKPRHWLQSQAGSLSGNCPECVSGPTMSFHLLFSKTVISILRWRKRLREVVSFAQEHQQGLKPTSVRPQTWAIFISSPCSKQRRK